MHHEIISFSATQPNTGAAAAALTGDSLNLRNAAPGSKILVVNTWSTQQVAGFQSIVAPSWNDTTRGIRVQSQIANTFPALPYSGLQPCQSQELLSITIAGSNVAGDVELGVLMVWYENVPGLDGTFLMPDDVKARGIRQVTVADVTAGTAGPGYSPGRALNAASDLLRPNTNYALMGASIRNTCSVLGVRSPDWSNVRVGIPGGNLHNDISSRWFELVSKETGYPMIPVLNSGNKAGIFIDTSTDENALAVNFSLNLVELPS